MENKMDGTTTEHSDSDSGDSWTLLEHTPSYADDAVDICDDKPDNKDEEVAYSSEKDEDTDGISIITDSEPESITPCEHLNYEDIQTQRDHPADETHKQFDSVIYHPLNSSDHHESMRCNDFPGDSSGKLKTYVHKRNKKLSTVLNIIVLGSVITAAGVAIGHMWGIRDDCAQQTPPSVNKILSNLYKLQEENAYLRNKLKEFTLANSFQMNNHNHKKNDFEKPLAFKQKCKKVFEESLSNRNAATLTKCVDSDMSNNALSGHLEQPTFEQDFVNDLNKLKNFYKQNKSWLDVEVARRLKNEKLSLKTMKQAIKTNKLNNQKKVNNDNIKKGLMSNIEGMDLVIQQEATEDINNNIIEKKKISYADSLKSEKDAITNHSEHRIYKRSLDEISFNKRLKTGGEKRQKKDFQPDSYVSDDEIKKDNRYTGHKYKQDKKKQDRHKSHKKLKSKNKYEQWEMKGGILNDYDEISMISSQDSLLTGVDKDKYVLNQQFNPDTYINKIIDSYEIDKKIPFDYNIQQTRDTKNDIKRKKDKEKNEKKSKEENWYEKRVALRTEARKKFEQELFGENKSNNASWYFRRMQKREQCRAKPDNSTYKKASKRNMNFKTKH